MAKVAIIEKTILKMGEKKEEVSMVQQRDKEVDSNELIDTKADAGE